MNVGGNTWSLNNVLSGQDLVGGTSSSNADYIEIWDPSTEGYEQFYYRSSNSKWSKGRKTFEEVHEEGLPPGATVWFYSQNEEAAPTVNLAGQILTNDDASTQLTLNQYNMLGCAFPIRLKLNDATQVRWGDAVGGTSSSNADYIEIWDPVTEGYEQFYYRDTGVWSKGRKTFEEIHEEGMEVNGGFWYFAQSRDEGADDEVTFFNPTKTTASQD